MADYVVMAGFFLPLLGAVAAYMYTRRRFFCCRSLLLFDISVLALAAVLSIAFWWREITGRVSQDIWLDEHGFLAVVIPMWFSAISIPILFFRAFLRKILFSSTPPNATVRSNKSLEPTDDRCVNSLLMMKTFHLGAECGAVTGGSALRTLLVLQSDSRL